MARFCDACGTPCADDATFCASCGKQLNAQPAPQQPVYQAPQQPQYQAPQYQQPQYQAPQYQQPQYQAPQYQQPQYQAPQYQAPQYQQPQYQTPQYQQPQYGYQPAPAAKPSGFVGYNRRQYFMITIAAIVAVFALLAGILNLFGLYNVHSNTYGTISYNGKQEPVPQEYLSDYYFPDLPLSVFRTYPQAFERYGLYIISTYVMGIVGLAAAGLLGYAVYLLFNNKPGSKNMLFYGSIALAAGSLVALLMGLFGGTGTYSEAISQYGITVAVNVTYTIDLNWTYWVCVILGAGLVVIDKVLFKEDSRPLQ